MSPCETSKASRGDSPDRLRAIDGALAREVMAIFDDWRTEPIEWSPFSRDELLARRIILAILDNPHVYQKIAELRSGGPDLGAQPA
jgi:hypothetical protein